MNLITDLYDFDLNKIIFDIRIILTKKQKIYIILETLCGIKELHHFNIVHLDLKLKNILSTKNFDKLVLADFGIAKVL